MTEKPSKSDRYSECYYLITSPPRHETLQPTKEVCILGQAYQAFNSDSIFVLAEA